MKKLLLLFALFMFSCGSETTSNREEITFERTYFSLDSYVAEFEYKGHLYVVYSAPYSRCLLHSPNCPCLKQE